MSDEFVQIQDVQIRAGTLVADRYQIVEHIGEGGFAQVFEAFDTNIERPVAIKFLNLSPSRSSGDGAERILARFKREAKLAARIQHPNVVNIFDFGLIGRQGDIPYIVMELLSGHDLEEQIFEKGPMEPRRALPLFVGCLEALGEAHKLGIVHKDLKPSNLFLSNPGQRTEALRIVDFGIAHIRTPQEGRLTATGEILGTPQYLPPEYIESQLVTPAYDVYQMGLIIVEALSGKPVVDENHPLRCVKIHSTGELDVPVGLLQSELGQTLARALHVDHSQRFEDAQEFADALARLDPAAIPQLDKNSDTQPLRTAQTLDSNSRMVQQQTGQINRPKTGRVASQQRVAQSDTAPEAAFGQQAGGLATSTATHQAGDDAQNRSQTAQSTLTALANASLRDPSVKLLAALAAVVVLLGGIAGWLIVSSLSADQKPAAEQGVAEAEETAEAALEPQNPDGADEEPSGEALAAAEEEADDAEDESEEETAAADEEPAPVTVTVESSPAGASVRKGSEDLGTTPLDIEFASADDDAVELTLERSGFESRKVEIEPSTELERVELEKERKPQKTRRPAKARSDSKPKERAASKPIEREPADTDPAEPAPRDESDAPASNDDSQEDEEPEETERFRIAP